MGTSRNIWTTRASWFSPCAPAARTIRPAIPLLDVCTLPDTAAPSKETTQMPDAQRSQLNFAVQARRPFAIGRTSQRLEKAQLIPPPRGGRALGSTELRYSRRRPATVAAATIKSDSPL